MSLLKTNSVQIGQSATATQNFTLAVPSSPDGTIKLDRGNAGDPTPTNIFSVSNTGIVTFANNIVQPNPTAAVNVCSVYRSASQSINTGVFNRVQLNLSIFDTGSFFDTVTNYRFLPTVAGYYNIYANVGMGSNGAGQRIAAIYKNGSEYRRLSATLPIGGASAILGGSCLISLNGSSDYVELWAFQDSASTQTITSANFDAYLVKGL
jgi:hypothetical protein